MRPDAEGMLNEKFLGRLKESFPEFYQRVNEEAMQEARDLRDAAHGDVQQALVRARMQGAARVWVPYVRGTIPFAGDDRPAMEAFSRLVLTVDHVVGYAPPSMEAARDQVVSVLRSSLDVERLRHLLERDEKQAAAGAAAGAGLLASASALMSPITAYRQARKWMRFVPAPMRVAAGAVVAAAILSVPLVAGYSAGIQAEKAARNFGETPPAKTAASAKSSTNGGSDKAKTEPSRSYRSASR